MEDNEQMTKKSAHRFWGGSKNGYATAFHMAWPAVLESFFISLAGMVDSWMVSSMGASAVGVIWFDFCPRWIDHI